jgi:2-polyprenyl-6-methoxyphenol hydroxylase-like FAD-dependent oxidoreductase
MAMLDALELSRCLSSAEFSDTQAAIAAYERQMRTRSGAIATMTLEQTASLHSVNAIAGMMALLA